MKVIIEAYNTADVWRFSGPVKLRIYARQSFWTSDGQFIPQGTPGQSNTAYLEIACTVTANVLTVPSFEIDSTVDSQDNIWATYDAELVAGNKRVDFLRGFAVNALADGDPSYTWPEIILFRNQIQPQSVPESMGRQVSAMITSAVGALNKASETNLGVVALDVDPVDPAFPIAVGINSPLLTAAQSPVVVNALDNGILADGAVIEDAAVTNGSPTLNSPTSAFTEALIGKTVAIAGAGAGGSTLITTILAAPGPTALTLATNALATIASTRAVHGTDSTTAVQTLMDSIAGLADKATIYFPKGNYLFATGSLNVPQGVQLQGSRESAAYNLGYRYANEPKPMDGRGTTFVVAAGEGSAAGRFMLLNSLAALRGVSMFWPAELATLAAPKLYPWAVEMFGAGCIVENVELVNPYQGIYSHIGQRQMVQNVVGLPLLTGLYASQQLGTSYYQDIDFGPVYTYAIPEGGPIGPLMSWIHANGTAFKIGRVDNAQFINCGHFAYSRGFRFVIDPAEVTTFAGGTGAPGGKAWAQFVNCLSDTAPFGCEIDDVQGGDSTGAVGVTFVGCEFTASQIFAIPGSTLVAFHVKATNTGRIGLTNCRFHLAAKNIVHESGRLSVSGGYFQTWTAKAIEILGGVVSIAGNTFKGGNAFPIITSNLAWVTVAGNVFEYAEHTVYTITNSNFNDSGNAYADGPMETAVTFQNGWANAGAGFQNVTFIKRNGRVYLRGMATGGVVATGTPVFTLPVGHRPPAGLLFPVQSNSSVGVISVASSGVVSVAQGNNASVNFDGIDFGVR